MVSVHRALRYLVPVVSHREERVERVEIVRPQIGLRWGRPARLQYSIENERGIQQSVSINWPNEKPKKFMRIIDVPISINDRLVKVPNPDDPEIDIEVRRYETMWFKFTEIRPKERLEQLQPTRTTHCHFTFNLHPPNEDA